VIINIFAHSKTEVSHFIQQAYKTSLAFACANQRPYVNNLSTADYPTQGASHGERKSNLDFQTVFDEAATAIRALPIRGAITRFVSLSSLYGKNEFGLFHFPTVYSQVFCLLLNFRNLHINPFKIFPNLKKTRYPRLAAGSNIKAKILVLWRCFLFVAKETGPVPNRFAQAPNFTNQGFRDLFPSIVTEWGIQGLSASYPPGRCNL